MKSPCIGICSIHGSDTCRGCGRTIEEIQGWHGMADDEKQAVLDRLNQETHHESNQRDLGQET